MSMDTLATVVIVGVTACGSLLLAALVSRLLLEILFRHLRPARRDMMAGDAGSRFPQPGAAALPFHGLARRECGSRGNAG